MPLYVWNGSEYVRVDDGAGNIQIKNVVYDVNKDGIIDADKIANLSRSKITDFFASPFWDNIPDKPTIPEPFYSTTDDLSDIVIHKMDDVTLTADTPTTFINIASSVELLSGIATAKYKVSPSKRLHTIYTIDGGSPVDITSVMARESSDDYWQEMAFIPIKADSSLKVELQFDDYDTEASAFAITKCPFLDEKKPNILFDIDEKSGEIKVIHEANKVIDASAYIPPEGCKHVHLIGKYELEQLPKDVPSRYIRYRNGKFERAKWGYVFRKEVSVLGQTQVLWERTFEFDRELSQEEIKQIEQELGAKFVEVI